MRSVTPRSKMYRAKLVCLSFGLQEAIESTCEDGTKVPRTSVKPAHTNLLCPEYITFSTFYPVSIKEGPAAAPAAYALQAAVLHQ